MLTKKEKELRLAWKVYSIAIVRADTQKNADYDAALEIYKQAIKSIEKKYKGGKV